MTAGIIAILFFTLLSLTFLTLSQQRIRDYGLIEGSIIGFLYFMAIPIGISMLAGPLRDPHFRAPAYDALTDINTTSNIFIGWFSLICTHFVTCKMAGARSHISTSFSDPRRDISILLLVTAAMTLFVFFLSGKQHGGHWMELKGAAFRANTSFILVANFANALRAMLFGGIIYAYHRGTIHQRQAIIIGLTYAIFDLIVSFNRITLSYFAIMACLIYWRRMPLIALVGTIAAPVITYLSNFWGTFRAIVLQNGLSTSNVLNAAKISSLATNAQEETTSRTLNAFFESSNIQVLHYIIDNYPANFSILYGETFVVRTIGILIPSTIWANKPTSFGVRLGEQIMDIRGLALNSTLFGEAYANFYFLWVPALMLYLVIISALFRYIARINPMAGPMSIFVGFALWRFDPSFGAICIVTALIFLFALRLTHVRSGN